MNFTNFRFSESPGNIFCLPFIFTSFRLIFLRENVSYLKYVFFFQKYKRRGGGQGYVSPNSLLSSPFTLSFSPFSTPFSPFSLPFFYPFLPLLLFFVPSILSPYPFSIPFHPFLPLSYLPPLSSFLLSLLLPLSPSPSLLFPIYPISLPFLLLSPSPSFISFSLSPLSLPFFYPFLPLLFFLPSILSPSPFSFSFLHPLL